MAQGNQTGDSKDIQKRALIASMKALGLKSAPVMRVMRKLCEAGHAQLVLEAAACVLLSKAELEGKVPPNAGVMSKDLAAAAEAALRDVASEYHQSGNPLTPRYAEVDHLHAELCKQWVQGFAPPIPETHSIRGTLSDPEVQDRLTIVTLVLRELIVDKTSPLGGEAEPSGYHLDADALEGLCRDAAVLMFRAFENPNLTNHDLIHTFRGKKAPDAG